jgi:hypothetical protein
MRSAIRGDDGMEGLLGTMLFALFVAAQSVAVIVLNRTIDEPPCAGRRRPADTMTKPSPHALPLLR